MTAADRFVVAAARDAYDALCLLEDQLDEHPGRALAHDALSREDLTRLRLHFEDVTLQKIKRALGGAA